MVFIPFEYCVIFILFIFFIMLDCYFCTNTHVGVTNTLYFSNQMTKIQHDAFKGTLTEYESDMRSLLVTYCEGESHRNIIRATIMCIFTLKNHHVVLSTGCNFFSVQFQKL